MVSSEASPSQGETPQDSATVFSKLSWLKLLDDYPDLINDGEHRVLVAVFNHTNKFGSNAYPGIDTLAEACGKNERTIRRILRSLEAKSCLVATEMGGWHHDENGVMRPWATKYALGDLRTGGHQRPPVGDMGVPHSVTGVQVGDMGVPQVGDMGVPQVGDMGVPPSEPYQQDLTISTSSANTLSNAGALDARAEPQARSCPLKVVTSTTASGKSKAKAPGGEERQGVLYPSLVPDMTFLSDDWVPNRTHEVAVGRLNAEKSDDDWLSVSGIHEEFRHQMLGQRRSDWDAAFTRYITDYDDGVHLNTFHGPKFRWDWYLQLDAELYQELENDRSADEIEAGFDQDCPEVELEFKRFRLRECAAAVESDGQQVSA